MMQMKRLALAGSITAISMSVASGQCISITSGSHTTADFTLSSGSTVQSVWTRSTAFSLSFARQAVAAPCCDPEYGPCIRTDQLYLASDSQAVEGYSSNAYASSSVSLGYPQMWWIYASAEVAASTSAPSPSGPEIVMDHESWITVGTCFECQTDYRARNAGRASAIYDVELASGGSFFYTFNPRVGGSSIFVGADGIMRVGAYWARSGYTPVVYGITGARNVIAPTGLTFDSQSGQWTGEEVIAGISGVPTTFGTFRYSDISIDVNGDDRFNALDADALELKIGDSEELDMNWDFDSNGEISQLDADILRQMAASGLGSGMLGDYDGDGTADCADLVLMSGVSPCAFGDAAYRVEVDADLDGDFDEMDRAVVCKSVQPADRNCDGVVEFADYLAFLTEYEVQDPGADMNGDGVVEFADYLEFLAYYDVGCP